MTTKLANFGGPNPHTSGLFADMTVDGPEIGTLVLIVDRAKNLPNRKTMGKQNPYCAARLGKEAKKTETDRRGGQTPRWDQELRFTVHDSPDYHKLKISIFSEDKRTDLIGEAWISLTEVVVPGGGKGDLWQGLNCKGKYAGELRIELTYYDSRPKPEGVESVFGQDDLRRSIGSAQRVKRRPLPSYGQGGHVTPDTIPQVMTPGRARHGPRDLQMPTRANSMPVEGYGPPTVVHVHHWDGSPAGQTYHTPPHQYHAEYDQDQYQEPQTYDDAGYSETPQEDLLPQLPPSNRQRGSLPPQPHLNTGHGQIIPRPRPQSHIGLPHSQSAPMVPQLHGEPNSYEDGPQLQLEYPEPIPDLEYQHQQLGPRRRKDVPPSFQAEYGNPYADRQLYGEEEAQPPPPPPMHSHSAPVIPQFSPGRGHLVSSPTSAGAATPPSARQNSIPTSSPLQNIELKYNPPQRTPPQASPVLRSYGSSPASAQAGQPPSPYGRSQPPNRPLPHRNSIADPYAPTPPRPHPLSQEVPRSRSPDPFQAQEPYGASSPFNSNSPYQQEYRSRDGVPLLKPRAISPGQGETAPQPGSTFRPKNTYSIQNPVRAFASSDRNPLSTSQPQPTLPQVSTFSTPRKSVSPNPTPPHSAGAVPYSPDSFNVHNPTAQPSSLSAQASPHSPYQLRQGSNAVPRAEANGPIKNWHGQDVDPSDHLPVDSWAPEPEKKTPTKTYGLGRDRDFGPRSVHSGSGGSGRSLSKDTVVNVRSRAQTDPEPDSPPRNRLQKKSTPAKSLVVAPLRERHDHNSISVPNPYEQQEYSRDFYQSNERVYNAYGSSSASPADALSREISNIDIGSGRHSRTGSIPAPTTYVPVKSHRDRNSFY